MPLTHPVELYPDSKRLDLGSSWRSRTWLLRLRIEQFIRDYITDPPKINHNACANWFAARRSTE
jgi:hypothetical protein